MKEQIQKTFTYYFSASKIVFVMLTFTACRAFLYGNLDEKDFMLLCMGAFTYYFADKKQGASDLQNSSQ